MTIHWTLFVPGLLLLLFPSDRLLSSMVTLRSFENFQSLENSPRYRPWWWVPALWIDPIRGLVGTLLLKHDFASAAADATVAARPAYWLVVGILGLAVLCQTFTRRDEHVLLAPIGFIGGMVAALAPLPVTLIGLAMATTGLFAFRRFHAFFSVGLAMVALLGLLFGARVVWLAPAVVALGLPIVAGVVTGYTLELPTRSGSGPRHLPV